MSRHDADCTHDGNDPIPLNQTIRVSIWHPHHTSPRIALAYMEAERHDLDNSPRSVTNYHYSFCVNAEI